jgi:hypothetical protein
MIKRGKSIEEAKRICSAPQRPTMLQQIAAVPLIASFSYGIFKILTQEKEK